MNWISFEKEYAGDLLNRNPWNERIEKMAGLLGDISSVADMGAGEGCLKCYLNKNIEYYPIDYCKRNDETIICDFNKGQFPDIRVDAYFISGCMEYITDWKWFVLKLCEKHPKQIVLSYAAVQEEYKGEQRGWYYNDVKCDFENSITETEIIREFEKNRYTVRKRDFDIQTGQPLFLFESGAVNERDALQTI